jgi:hypothetical protein
MEREDTKGQIVAADWQVNLMGSIARGQFCYAYTTYDATLDVRRHGLIGRRMNVAATIRVYEYLVGAVTRLNPYTDGRKKKSRLSWFDGCSERLCERLYRQRADAEAASRAARGDTPRGNGSDLVLADVFSSESDLNMDMRNGLEPGETARRREAYRAGEAERRERWAREEREAQAARAAETPAQQRARERANKRWEREYQSRQRQEAKKRDPNAYAMGTNAAAFIGLDVQVGTEKRAAIR